MSPYLENNRGAWSVIVIVIAVMVFVGAIIWGIDRSESTSTPTPVVTSISATPTTEVPFPTAPPTGTITISMYSSDTKEDWLDKVIADFNAKQVPVASGRPIFVYHYPVKSGSSMDDIKNRVISPTIWSPGEQTWVLQINQYWQDLYGYPLIPDPCQATVYAPIGFAMWRPMAEAMFWPDTPIGWDDIIALAADPAGWGLYGHPEWGQFKFGHTHPDLSNSGLLILTTLADSTSGQTSGLTPAMVKSTPFVDAMRTIELHTYHYGRSSKDNIVPMIERGPEFLHATNATEAETLKANSGAYGIPHFPLAFIFPAGGAFWAEQPFCVLDEAWVSSDQQEAARLFEGYLHEQAQQELAMQYYLRPVDPTIALTFTIAMGTDPSVTTATVTQLGSPSAEVAEAVKDVFDQTRKKLTIVLVLDTSDSMTGEKIQNAAEAAAKMVEADELRPEDDVIAYVFNETVTELQAPSREKLAATLRNLFAQGGTALNDAVIMAVERVKTLRAQDEAAQAPRLYGIVVLSDGEDTTSLKTENDMFNALPTGEDVEGVRVFTIAYGADADPDEETCRVEDATQDKNIDLLLRLANRTHGKCYLANPDDIEEILLEILFQ